MIGYHYTTEENWKKIKKMGLSPALIHRIEVQMELRKYYQYPPQVFGVWLWRRKQDPLSHMGNVIRAAVVHGSPRVVLLEVEFEEKELVRVGGRKLSLSHDGAIEKIIYHKNEPSYIVGNTIPPEKIKVVDRFDLVKALASAYGSEVLKPYEEPIEVSIEA